MTKREKENQKNAMIRAEVFGAEKLRTSEGFGIWWSDILMKTSEIQKKAKIEFDQWLDENGLVNIYGTIVEKDSLRMPFEQAKEHAETAVHVYYNRPDIISACESRGIKTSSNRNDMERALIKAMIMEMVGLQP